MKKLTQLIEDNIATGGLYNLFHRKRKNITADYPIITISREKGSGGRPIAFLIEKKLGTPWKVFHKDIVEKIAKETNLEKNLLSEIDERNIPLIENIIADIFGKRYLSLSSYYKHLIKILGTIRQRGHAIIVGRGANFLIPSALKVRVICDMEQRIKWLMEFEKITRNTAIRRIEKSDEERTEFNQTLFHHDHRKAHHYDMIIRTGPHLSINNAADLIVNLAQKRFKK